MYTIDGFKFTDKDVTNMQKVGITPDSIKGWIADGRENGISDNGIRQFIKDQYRPLAEAYNAEQNKKNRGANVVGALRYVASMTPFVGGAVDEVEAALRAGSTSGEEYDRWLKNARESRAGAKASFERNAKNGNWFDRNIGLYAPEALNLTENAVLATLTGGRTLMPSMSAAQGAMEGFLSGEGGENRTSRAIAGGTIGYVVPYVLNRLFPTKGVQTRTVDALTKSKDAPEQIIAKALKDGTTPEDIIAREVPKGMRPDLWSNIRRNSVGENVYRKTLQRQASDTYSKPYSRYIVEEIGGASPKYANKIGQEIERLRLDELADDVIGEFDPRAVVMDAVNSVMRGAPAAEREMIGQTVADAVVRRGVAKKLSSATIERPVSTASGSIMNLLRRASVAPRDILNAGTIRTMTVGTPNYVSENMLERLLNRTAPEWLRGALDAAIEQNEMNNLVK